MLKFSMMTPMKRLSVKKEPKTMKKTKYKYIQSRTSRRCCSSFYAQRQPKTLPNWISSDLIESISGVKVVEMANAIPMFKETSQQKKNRK